MSRQNKISIISVETIPGMGEGRIRESNGRGEIMYDIVDIL
jgi:hypothetical protein